LKNHETLDLPINHVHFRGAFASKDMKNWHEIQVCLSEYSKVLDLSLDWLIKALDLQDEDRTIALAYYQKALKKRLELSKQLNTLCQN